MSILDDIEDQINDFSIVDKLEITKWLKANVKSIEKNRLKFDSSTTPTTVNYDGDIEFKTHISSLTNEFFQWGEVDGNFFCCDCLNLKTLEGAAENISGNYYCVNCRSLSLDNVSEKIREKVVFFEKCEKNNKEDKAINDLLQKSYEKINDKYNCVTPEFLEKVKDVYLNKVMPSIRDMVNSHWLIKYLICIMKNIPIHFDKQMRFEGYDDGKYLGLYRRNNDGTREIILFEDAIQAEAKGDNDYLKNLIWKVIIHEYAHAMMDTLQDNKIKSQDPKLYKYREESLANAFALKVLEMSIENTLITKSGFDKIEDFVKSQPEEYRYGHDLYKSKDKDPLKMMEFWREMKIEVNKRFK